MVIISKVKFVFYALVLSLILSPSVIRTSSVNFDVNNSTFDTTGEESRDKDSQIKSYLPHIKWKQVEPCSKHLNETVEWQKTLECASKVFSESEIRLLTTKSLPECYVIKEEAPGVFKTRTNNYIPVFNPGTKTFGAVLGVYDQKTTIIFLVENYDINDTYRHEAQHYIFTQLNKEAQDRGITAHSHDIWEECEPAYYKPSRDSVKHYRNRDVSKADVVMENLLIYSHKTAVESVLSIF